MAPRASKWRRLARWIDDLTIGVSGVVAVILGIASQAFWVLRINGSIGLADALAIEGVIVAVVLGFLALKVALHHDTDLKQVSGTLKGVSDSVLTRTVGVFPDFIPHVTDLLGKAEKSILVMCDNPAYGIVSNGAAFDAYLVELKKKIALRTSPASLSVELMFLADKEREELHKDQVHLPDDDSRQEKWEGWRDEYSILLKEFFKRAHGICEPDAEESLTDDSVARTVSELSFEKYIERLLDVNSAVLKHHLYNSKRCLLEFRDQDDKPKARSHGPSVYFWMRDGRHAIFAIVPLGKEPKQSREVAFETHDPDMIEALRGMFSRYGSAATEIRD